jgi:hypothetical protein
VQDKIKKTITFTVEIKVYTKLFSLGPPPLQVDNRAGVFPRAQELRAATRRAVVTFRHFFNFSQ